MLDGAVGDLGSGCGLSNGWYATHTVECTTHLLKYVLLAVIRPKHSIKHERMLAVVSLAWVLQSQRGRS